MDKNYYLNNVKTQTKFDLDEFPRFAELPAELRSKVWEYAMPPYGIFTALMFGQEEPTPQQPPNHMPMVFRVVYRLEPVPLDQQDDNMRARHESITAIQRTNLEAASEVQRAFPTTIECTNGRIRFNAGYYVMRLSNAQCPLKNGFLKRFARYSQGAVTFANDWHKIPQQIVFDNERLWCTLRVVEKWVRGHHLEDPLILPPTKGFIEFISECNNLRILAVSKGDDRQMGHFLHGFFDWYHAVPIEHGWIYGQNRYVHSLQNLCLSTSGFRSLAALARGRLPILGNDKYLDSLSIAKLRT